ncbi:FG-GAP-like repeat-containing protein [Saprospiraceae bacterium]|nr:FG-GAP-like repeat-containing protein [Saprospiraceae bacterium]
MKTANTQLLFTLLLLTSSLSAQNQFIDSAQAMGIEHTYGVGSAGGGVSFCDFTGDGLDDLTIATQSGDDILFYENNGNGFTALPPMVEDVFEVKQIIWVDFDNDGDKDLYLSNLDGNNRLFENDGDFNLNDITETAGLPLTVFASYGACWADVDRDGWLDVYFTKRAVPFSSNQAWLYRNNSDGTFTDFSDYSGSSDPSKAAFMPVFVDINNDLWPDIYTAHDKTQINTLLRNDGDLTFSDISEISNADEQINAMGVAVGDYDNDGDLDIYISNTDDGNKLLNNQGDETFVEMAESSGVGFFGIGWGTNFFDADNDGDLDLYASGMSVSSTLVSSLFFENNGDGSFFVPEANFAGDTVSSFGNAIGDFNNDGLLDIFVNNTAPFQSHLWMNSAQNNSNNFVKINLQGVVSNRDGVGAWIKLFIDGQSQVRYTHSGTSFLGQNSQTTLFGINQSDMIDSLQVLWPTGHSDVLYDVLPNQLLTILEGSTTNGEIYVDPETEIIINDTKSTELQSELVVLTNPSNGNLYIKAIEGRIEKLQIMNESGALVFHKNYLDGTFEVNLHPNLDSGIYFIHVENEKRMTQILRWVVEN